MSYIKLEDLKKFPFRLNSNDFNLGVEAIIEYAENLPIADVEEVKHGKWVYHHWCEFRCSICGHWSKTEPRGEENFCPNCGAKMDK